MQKKKKKKNPATKISKNKRKLTVFEMCFVFSSLIKGQILQDGGLGTASVSARMMFMYLYFTMF